MFVFIGRFVAAAVITFLVILAMTPIVYNIWFNNLRDMNEGTLQAAGDTFFANFQILSFLVPGLIIVWGFVVAVRKRAQDTYDSAYTDI